MDTTADARSNALQTMPASQLLPLIVSQLKHYGYYAAAKFVADTTEVTEDFAPSQRLSELCFLGKQARDALGIDAPDDDLLAGTSTFERSADLADDVGSLSIDTANPPTEPRPDSEPRLLFTTQHRGIVRAAAISPDGKIAATGSQDNTVKILDVPRIIAQHADTAEDKKVLRTFYDHTAPVNDVKFAPSGFVLASGSDDFNIKLYDVQKPHTRRAFRYFADAYPVRSISFHPTGEFLFSGTDHHAIRIYDVYNMRSYIPNQPGDHHDGGILSVCCAPNGVHLASGSSDGNIKIYDNVSSRSVNTIAAAHGGMPVTSVLFSKSSKYLLTTGMDSVGRLWDMTSGKTIVKYEGATIRSDKSNMVFSFNEDHVIGLDEDTSSIVVWDARMGKQMRRMNAHNKPMRYVASSPKDPCVVTCGEDSRARFWLTGKPATQQKSAQPAPQTR